MGEIFEIDPYSSSPSFNYNILSMDHDPYTNDNVKDFENGKKTNPLGIGHGDDNDDVFDDDDLSIDINTFEDIVSRVSIPGASLSMTEHQDQFDYNSYFQPKPSTSSSSNQSEYEKEKKRLERVIDKKILEEDIGFLKLSFFPKTPDHVSSNRSGLYEWIFNYQADWGIAMIDAYKSMAFTHSFEQKQFSYFKFGNSVFVYSSGATQPYREKSLIEPSNELVSKVVSAWKPLEKSDLKFILHKEKNTITQKTVFMIEFISEKLRKVIPYLKGTINIQSSTDRSTITHIVTISTWLDFSGDSSGWMSKISTTMHQRNMSSSVYYGLDYFFKTLFIETNKIFEQ